MQKFAFFNREKEKSPISYDALFLIQNKWGTL
jgi:hypothetical protein